MDNKSQNELTLFKKKLLKEIEMAAYTPWDYYNDIEGEKEVVDLEYVKKLIT